jgi:malate dehydrogenase (oxaloacetate-decarboxylating)
MRDGLTEAQARSRFYIVNRGGLLHTERTDLNAEQKPFAQPPEAIASFPRGASGVIGLEEVIASVPASILIGLSTVGGAFTEPVVREMARKTPRPIIFPLSNPTSKAEAAPADLIHWTQGRALIATGSPFGPVMNGGRSIRISQCNNVYIFPAIGLALAACGATRVTDDMLLAAARALGERSPALTDRNASLLPPLRELRTVARHIAKAVALQAMAEGHAHAMPEAELEHRIEQCQWTPRYE